MSEPSEVNPYESSRSSPRRVLNLQRGDHGPWRDGQFLVADVDVYDVDISRCIASGLDVQRDERRVLAVYGPQILFTDSVYPLRWPVARHVRFRFGVLDVIGWLIILAGVIAGFLEYFGATSRGWGFQIAAGAIPMGTFALIFIDRKFVRLHHREGRLAWFSGIHPRCLEGLPDFSTSTSPR